MKRRLQRNRKGEISSCCSGACCLRKLAILIFRQSETNLLIKSKVWSCVARYFSFVLRSQKGIVRTVMGNENAWKMKKDGKGEREKGGEEVREEKTRRWRTSDTSLENEEERGSRMTVSSVVRRSAGNF